MPGANLGRRGQLAAPASISTVAVLRDLSLWTDDERREPLATPSPPSDGRILWAEVDGGASPEAVFSALRDSCRGLELHAVRRLLDGDAEVRGCEQFGDGETRLTRACLLRVEDAQGPEDGDAAVGAVVAQPVTLLCGPDWLVTAWLAPLRHAGGDTRAEGAAGSSGRCLRAVERRWVAEKLGRSAGDLGVLVLHELALSFGPAVRGLSSWLEAWELNLYRFRHDDPVALRELWSAMAFVRAWIAPLNLPGVNDDVDKSWVPGATDLRMVDRVDDRIDRALANLGGLARILRSAFAAEGARRAEGRERRLEYVGVVLLMPTLVVGFYGANVALPGGGHWSGFGEMVASMVLLTALAVTVVWLLHRGDSEPLRRSEARERQPAISSARPNAR